MLKKLILKLKFKKLTLEWKKELSPTEYYVLRESGTERAFTGEYNKLYKDGVYHCKGCDTPLFKSNTNLIQELDGHRLTLQLKETLVMILIKT